MFKHQVKYFLNIKFEQFHASSWRKMNEISKIASILLQSCLFHYGIANDKIKGMGIP